MTDKFESILDESISALQAGVPLEEILAEVPDYAAELRPMLYAALLLADPNPTLAPAERKAALKAEYLAQATELPPRPPTLKEKVGAATHVIRRRTTAKAVLSDLATITITVVLTLMMVAGVLTYLAQDTIPGDFLYGIKQLSERTQLMLTFDETRQAELANEFNQRRLAEIDQLLQIKRPAVVRFQGVLETKGANLWIVAGHTVLLPADATIEGTPEESDTVEVVGLLRTNNVIIADEIRLSQPPQ